MVSVTRENIINMLTTLLEQFRGGGFYMPRTRDQLNIKFIGAPVVREHIIEQLIAYEVLEERASRGLQVVKKNSASVTALLDNGTLNGAVHSAANEVIKQFKAGAVAAG